MAVLYGGGSMDGQFIDLGDSLSYRIVFPRYQDGGLLVNDVYVFAGAMFHYDGVPHPFCYTGEEMLPVPDPALLRLTRGERFRDWLAVVRRGWWRE
jgi:hypothetical protein